VHVVTPRLAAASAAISLAASGCTPALDDRLSLLDGPRVLAIAATPAEQAPAKEATFEALFASPGDAPPPALSWAFCIERKPLAEPGAVSTDCLRRSGPGLAPLGSGSTVTGTVPDDACRVFGPDPPANTAGEPAGRAADPDLSGGYYQPLRLRFADGGRDVYTTGAVRIACGLPGATPEQALEMTRRYRRNERPGVRSLALVRGSRSEDVTPDAPGAEPGATVAPGEELVWRARWDACPTSSTCGDGVCGVDEEVTTCADDCTEPAGCAGAEQYVLFDPEQRAVVERREALQLSWYATAGAFAHDRTGRSADEAAQNSSENPWTAPDEEGDVTLWAVLRDDRGGVGWQRYRVRVAR
jgi:hypothetical protein